MGDGAKSVRLGKEFIAPVRDANSHLELLVLKTFS